MYDVKAMEAELRRKLEEFGEIEDPELRSRKIAEFETKLRTDVYDDCDREIRRCKGIKVMAAVMFLHRSEPDAETLNDVARSKGISLAELRQMIADEARVSPADVDYTLTRPLDPAAI